MKMKRSMAVVDAGDIGKAMVRARDMVEVTGSEGVGFINIIIYGEDAK
jgi:hypothetical protein